MLNLVSQKHTPIPIGWWLSDPAVNRVAFGVILSSKKQNLDCGENIERIASRKVRNSCRGRVPRR